MRLSVNYGWTIGLVLLAAPVAAQEIRPSFDCAKARSNAEMLICSDAGLSQLDLELAEAYKAGLAAGTADKASQRRWIERRDAECSTPNAKECVRRHLESRIAELLATGRSPGGQENPTAGKYRFSDAWPLGIGDRMVRMRREDAPICRSVAKALNQSRLPKPLAPYHDPPLKEAGVEEVTWVPAAVTNPIAVIQRFHQGTAAKTDDPQWIAQWQERLDSGKVRLETAILPGFQSDPPATRLLRVTDDRRVTKEVWTLLAIVDENFEHVRPVTGGRGSPDTAFTFEGRGYVLGLSLESFDSTTGRPLARPRHDVYVNKGDTEGDFAICRLVYREGRPK
jgi:uncharacterized protein YecT (DUF1311 family)